MKKLLSPGVVAIVSDRARVQAPAAMGGASPQSRVSITGPRIFPSVGAFADGFEPWNLNVFFQLVDLQSWHYVYAGVGSKEASDRVGSLLNHSYPDGTGPASGGILFNASVRPTLLSKSLT
jgi:hypothetical protein